MTDNEIKTKFNNLSQEVQKQINREAGIIRQCGANHFFIETGCHVDDKNVGWLLMAFAMLHLGLVTSKEFYGA